jgi:hypothetical protein
LNGLSIAITIFMGLIPRLGPVQTRPGVLD